MSGWTAKDMPNQSGRVVLITGANSGVGYESALAFARKQARVIMACRSLEKAENARKDILRLIPGAELDVLPLDLGSLHSIRSFAEAVDARYDRLDILMNNAGIMVPPYGKTADGFETQFGTNHLGHFALTGLLLPKLLNTPASRVVTVSSSAADLNARINFDDLQSERHYSPIAAYGQSKLANLLFMLELQRRLEAIDADTISVASQPGYARTNLQNHAGTFLSGVLRSILEPTTSQSAEMGATYQLYAATAPGVRGGDYYQPRFVLRGEVVRSKPNARARDAAVAARLWQVSEQLTGVRYETPVLV
jgi:NAD(P)-dependent dehydrogenase (short-subunit alcohol dehydrogenase family)